MRSEIFTAAAFGTLGLAKTDIAGCTSSQTTDQYGEASMIYWEQGSGEICAFLDCGGGMAPPMTDVPGCPLYSGPASYSPSYMPGYRSATATSVIASSIAASASGSGSPSAASEGNSVYFGASATSYGQQPTITLTASTSASASAGSEDVTTTVTAAAAGIPTTPAPSVGIPTTPAPSVGTTLVAASNGTATSVKTGSPSASPSSFEGAAASMVGTGMTGVAGLAVGLLVAAIAL